MFTNDFEIIEKKSPDILFFIKIHVKTIQKLFRSIIAIRKHEDEIYILVVGNMQYSGGVSWNVPVWSCSLCKRSLTTGPD